MDEGSTRSTRGSSRRARAIGAGVIAAIVIALLAGALVRSRGTSTDLWAARFESIDAAVVTQDVAQIRHDLGLSPSGAVASLRFDCEIGRRDAARLLSHPSPSVAVLRRAYKTVLQQNWRLYSSCASALANGAPVGAVRTRLDEGLSLLRHDEARVNAVARSVATTPVFSGRG